MENFLSVNHNSRGFIMLITSVFFLIIILTVVIGVVAPAMRQVNQARYLIASKQSYFAAEGGSEDAFYRVRNNIATTFPYTMTVGNATVTMTNTDLGNNQSDLLAVGNQDNFIRKVDKILT